jgi:hypothetical protein
MQRWGGVLWGLELPPSEGGEIARMNWRGKRPEGAVRVHLIVSPRTSDRARP